MEFNRDSPAIDEEIRHMEFSGTFNFFNEEFPLN